MEEGGGMRKLTPVFGRKVYEKYLVGRGVKPQSIEKDLWGLKVFLTYLIEKGINDLREVDEVLIEEYATYLLESKTKIEKIPYASSTLLNMFGVVKHFFRALYLEGLILINPTQNIEFNPKGVKRKREVFSQKEIADFLDEIDIHSPCGLRDRTLFELIYSSGLRVSEAAGIKIGDINFETRLIKIRGKWDRDRIIPISKVAVKFLKMYLAGRKERKEDYVFKGRHGALKGGSITERFGHLISQMGRKKKGLVTHSIRHSVATHLLENGAGVRYVQELLGHETIETTVRYTHMLYDNLKRVYKRYHPKENDYYEEVGEEYRNHLLKFKQELKGLKRNRK